MSTKEFVDQVAVLRQERDLARSERDLMERMYHGSLGTAENCSKLNQALKEWQLQSMPAVRAVREILNQRPELHGPDGIVRAVLNGVTTNGAHGGAGALPPGESVCVGEIIPQPDGGAFLRCTNCNVVVVKVGANELSQLRSSCDAWLREHWAEDWAQHTKRKQVLDAVFAPLDGGQTNGAHGVTRPTTKADQPEDKPNPNAGVKQAFAKGRWTR